MALFRFFSIRQRYITIVTPFGSPCNCDECRHITDVDPFLHNSLDAKEAEVTEITKKLKKLKYEHKKTKDLHKEALDTVHDTLGNVTKRNNDLNIELAKEKSLVTALK